MSKRQNWSIIGQFGWLPKYGIEGHDPQVESSAIYDNMMLTCLLATSVSNWYICTHTCAHLIGCCVCLFVNSHRKWDKLWRHIAIQNVLPNINEWTDTPFIYSYPLGSCQYVRFVIRQTLQTHPAKTELISNVYYQMTTLWRADLSDQKHCWRMSIVKSL